MAGARASTTPGVFAGFMMGNKLLVITGTFVARCRNWRRRCR